MKTSEWGALVDLDGTLCDDDGAMARDMERLRGPGDPAVYPEDESQHPWLHERRSLIRERAEADT